jgi:hypothetical protein
MARAASKFSHSAPAVEREFSMTRLLEEHPLKAAVLILLSCRGRRHLNPRGCSADAAHGACRAATLIFPPIR